MAYEISVHRLPEVAVASTVIPGIPLSAVGAALDGALPDVFSHLQANGAAMVGAPFVRYHRGESDSTVDLEVGIPVAGPFPETDTIKARSLPGGDAISTVRAGASEPLADAVAALAEWRAANRRSAAGAYWESYLDDPFEVPPDQVRTVLVGPVADEPVS